MRFEMRITCKNAAFDEYPRDEISRLLRSVADTIETPDTGTLREYNYNGNTVGDFELIKEINDDPA